MERYHKVAIEVELLGRSINQRGQVTEINASQAHEITLPSHSSLTLQQLPDKATNVTRHKVQ